MKCFEGNKASDNNSLMKKIKNIIHDVYELYIYLVNLLFFIKCDV